MAIQARPAAKYLLGSVSVRSREQINETETAKAV